MPSPDPWKGKAMELNQEVFEHLTAEELAEGEAEYNRRAWEAFEEAARAEYEAAERLQQAEDRVGIGIAGSTAVPAAELGAEGAAAPAVVEDIFYEGQIVSFNAEEGTGKTSLAWEMAAQMVTGGPVFGGYAVRGPVDRVLVVDFEQSREDAMLVRDEVRERGMNTDGIFWLDANGRTFDNAGDRRWLRAEVQALRPSVVVLDTGTEAVSKASDDEVVKSLFIELREWMRTEGVRGCVILGQARKRSQEARGERKFDDLFGSRVWKGRASAAYWMENDTFTVWKQRGNRLKKRWSSTERYPKGRLVRTEGASLLLAPRSAADEQAERRARIRKVIGEEPEQWSMTSLVEDRLKVPGRNRPDWHTDIKALADAGELLQLGRYKVLRLNNA